VYGLTSARIGPHAFSLVKFTPDGLEQMEPSANPSLMDESQNEAERKCQFAELLREHHRDLFNFIYSLVQHHADAEDVFQQTTLVLWRKFDDFVIGTNFAAWATRVAHLTARDFVRSRRRHVPSFSDELLESIASAYRPRGPDFSAMRLEALGRCVEKLSRRDRRLVVRCYSRGRQFSEIAKAEGRSVTAIYQAICRIRKNLYRCVDRAMAMENR
jgi:RNA polymerase sigma-70 factor, ECF subfamily